MSESEPNVFAPVEKTLTMKPQPTWRFPAASVSAVELELNPSLT